jgi:hypothetical protein
LKETVGFNASVCGGTSFTMLDAQTIQSDTGKDTTLNRIVNECGNYLRWRSSFPT